MLKKGPSNKNNFLINVKVLLEELLYVTELLGRMIKIFKNQFY